MAATPLTSTTSGNGTGEVTTLLGRGSEFEGTVRVDGKLSGEIFTDDVLIIGEGAEVHAEINVGAVVIEGTVHGNIHAKRSVEIHTPARVRGNISTPSLSIDKGVIFDGQCQMEQTGGAAAKPRPPGPSASPATVD
jgi:cytoskeletal protein CcmA (bactofilin family)